MHKILVFDLDGTLAPIGQQIENDNIELLKSLELKGYKIAICSGKPTYYLCGLFRQTGIKNPIFIGENGGMIQYGIDLPPKKFLVHPVSAKAKEQLNFFRETISVKCNSIWFQPNEIAVTPFPYLKKDFEVIENLISDNSDKLSELTVYPQCDCFDFTPNNISKSSGLALLAKEEGFEKSDFIAIGDGINDIPMFDFADVSISIGNKLDYKTDYNFDEIKDALLFILTNSL